MLVCVIRNFPTHNFGWIVALTLCTKQIQNKHLVISVHSLDRDLNCLACFLGLDLECCCLLSLEPDLDLNCPLCFLGLSLDCDLDRDCFPISLDSDLDLDRDFALNCVDLRPLDSDLGLDCDLNCPPCLLFLFLDSDLDRLLSLDCDCDSSFTNLDFETSAASFPVSFLFALSMACEPPTESSLAGETLRLFLFFSLRVS